MTIVVLKFGSSVLRSESDLPGAVHEIYRWWRDGRRVVAVVSAFGSTTDDLLRRADRLALPRQPAGLAALLSTGETTSATSGSGTLQRASARICTKSPGPTTRRAVALKNSSGRGAL